MCGVPYHAADGYIARLIQRGYRVAICEQMEEAGPGKKLVRREITRMITPVLRPKRICSVRTRITIWRRSFGKRQRSGLAYVDVSTGEFRTTELDTTELASTLWKRLNVREVLHPRGVPDRSNVSRNTARALDFWGRLCRASDPRERSACCRSMGADSGTSRWPLPRRAPFFITCARPRSARSIT